MMSQCDQLRVCVKLKKRQDCTFPDITLTPNFDLADALESVYPLLEIVFEYLTCEDLRRAALVKKSWEITANKVLRKRNEVSHVTMYQKRKRTLVTHSSNYYYNNYNVGIFVHSSPIEHCYDNFCCHGSDLRTIQFSDFLSHEIIPEGVRQSVVIGCRKVASYFPQEIRPKSSASILEGCLIPHIPNVQVSILSQNENVKPTANQKLCCLLLFTKTLSGRIAQKLKEIVPEEQPRAVALGGGVTKKLHRLPCNGPWPPTVTRFFIAFYEDASCESVFNAFSVVIEGDNLPRKEFVKQLQEFKENIVVRQRSLAFMMCCAAKWRKKREKEIFNKLFPKTAILGLEVEGEVGWNSVPRHEHEDGASAPKKPKLGLPNFKHQWSTVIVFLTWDM